MMKKNLKWLATIMTFFLVSYHTAHAQWVQANGPGGLNIMALCVSGATIFAGTRDGVHRSTDNGASWTAANSGLTNTNVVAFAVSGNNIFAGTNGGGVYVSTDNGASWAQFGTGLPAGSGVTALVASGTGS